MQCPVSKSLVDTFVEDETVNRQNYQLCKEKKLKNKMIVRQDGTSLHFAKEVRTW